MGDGATGQTAFGSDGASGAERTSSGKQHFAVLDGLRGVAALLVVVLHIQGIMVDFRQGELLVPHGYLAVDFFFALSGFVIGYAYDDRWGRMSLVSFFQARLKRLHPLAVLGVLIGFACYVLDPFDAGAQDVSWATLLTALVMGVLLLPTAPLPNRWVDTHTLNSPTWTLFQEYLANIAYALVLRRLSTRMIGALALIAAAVLIACGVMIGTLDRGAGWDTFWMAPVRLSFPFLAGLWLYRVRERLPAIRIGYLPLTVTMVIALSLPALPTVAGVKWNGVYETLCVVLLFPLLVAGGAHSQAGPGMDRLCRFGGQISYPLYVTHFPFLFVWMNYLRHEQISGDVRTWSALALLPFTLLVAWAAYKLWDVPIRKRLRGQG